MLSGIQKTIGTVSGPLTSWVAPFSSASYSTTGAAARNPRHLFKITDFTPEEISAVLNRAARFKLDFSGNSATDGSGSQARPLSGRQVALLFTKRSTRTRVSTECAAAHLGGNSMFLGKDDIQLGVNESLHDTAKVISSMAAGIVVRTDAHSKLETLADASSVPVINGLTDDHHPLQALADCLTIMESFGSDLHGLKLTWVGDSTNVLVDLAYAACMLGMDVTVSSPKNYKVKPEHQQEAERIAKLHGSTFSIVDSPVEAIKDANVIVTDTWVSMGQEDQKASKLKEFSGFQVNEQLIEQGKPASNYIFMHCLPRKKDEVSDGVFYGSHSRVFEEAENRMWTMISVLEFFIINKGQLKTSN